MAMPETKIIKDWQNDKEEVNQDQKVSKEDISKPEKSEKKKESQ